MTYRLRILRDRGAGSSQITAVRPLRNGTALADIPVTQPITYPLELDLPSVQGGDEVRYAWVNAAGASDALPTALIAASIATITTPLSLTSGISGITVDLDSIESPAAGTWEYSLLAPGIGQVLDGTSYSLLEIGTEVLDGTYTVRRTVSDGALENLAFPVTVVEPSLTVASGKGTLLIADDDPASTDYAIPITDPGGVFDGLTATINRGDVDAIEPAPGVDPDRVLFVIDGLIGFETDTDSDGQADASDVVQILRPPLPVQFSGPAVPIASQWYIDDLPTDLTAETYSFTGTPPGASIKRAWTDGTTTVFSNALPLAAAAPIALAAPVLVNNIAWNTGVTDGLTRSYGGAAPSAGRFLVAYFGRTGASYETVSATLAGVPCNVLTDGTHTAAVPVIGATSTNHLIVFAATVAEAGDFVITTTTNLPNDGRIFVFSLDPDAVVHDVNTLPSFGNLTAPWQVNRDVNTVDGGMMFVLARTDAPTAANTFNNSIGFTQRLSQAIGVNERLMYGDATGTVAELRQVRVGDGVTNSGFEGRILAIAFRRA